MGHRHSGRKLRNYLLDKHLQLSFALFIVGVTAALTAVLIAVIVYETRQATRTFNKQRKESTETFTRLRREATQLFIEQRKRAREIYKKQLSVATDMLNVMSKDPDLKDIAARTQEEIRKQDAKAVETRKKQDIELRKRREAEDRQIEAQRRKEDATLAAKQARTQKILIGAMVGFSVIFLVAVFLYGIVITHKVAGPLFKISRYMNEVKDGRFPKLYGLRKGDQLVDFFNEFWSMYDTIKDRTAEDLALLEALRDAIKDKGLDSELLARLDAAIQAKRSGLDADQKKS